MRHLRHVLLCYLCLGMFIFHSCEEEAEQPDSHQDNSLIIDYLSDLGLNIDELEVDEESITIDEDARMDRDFILSAAKGDLPQEETQENLDQAETRQRGVLSNEYYHSINIYYTDVDYYIAPSVASDLGNVWVRAIEDAANKWNAVSNCKIRLNKSSSSGAEIYIGSDNDTRLPSDMRNLSSSTLGKGDFPHYNRVGKYISFNANTRGYTWGQALELAMHEIGHNLGLHHTNRSSGSHIGSTISHDGRSVMNQSDPDLNINLTANDKTAIRAFYPESLDQPKVIIMTDHNASPGSLLLIMESKNYTEKPYYRVRIKRYALGGYQVGFKDFDYKPYNSKGWQQIWWHGFNAGDSYYFSVQGLNFRKDVKSQESPKYRVDF